MDGTMDTRLEQLAAELAAMRDENRELRARLDALEDRPTPVASAPSPASAPTPATSQTHASVESTTSTTTPTHTAPQGMDRRRLLRDGLVAGAAATAAVVATGQPAAAADGDPLELGTTNVATSPTVLSAEGADQALQVTGGQLGIRASGIMGAAFNGSTYGIGISGPYSQLRLSRPAERAAPENDPYPHLRGDFVLDSAGDLWLCVEDGTFNGSGGQNLPGRFRKITGPTSAGAFHVLPAPARLYDSRPGTNPPTGPKTPFAANAVRTFNVTVGTGVPNRATAVLVTLLLVNASTTAGNLTVWSADKPKPLSNSVVWGGTARRFTATAVTAIGRPESGLGDLGNKIQVHASQPTDLVIDVVGYYK